MYYITIDPYYNIQFYNETKEALKNNNVPFKEYISVKPPYNYYFEVEQKPMFINFDEAPLAYSRWLVNIIRPLKPNEDYLYMRRESYTNIKAIEYYAVNDALKAVRDSNEGVFFTSTKEEILSISKKYPRKLYYMGRYFNRKYRVFLADSLMIKNFVRTEQILAQGDKFESVTDLEVDLNYTGFHKKDKLVKLAETPYVLNGKYYPVMTTRPDLTDMYILS